MKSVILCAAMLLAMKISVCQNMDELLQQKQTQRKYLIKQIAAFKQYVGYLQKGYQVIKKGTAVVTKIKEGDFNIHSDFFASLKDVNPLIRNSSKVADILFYQLMINKQAKSFLQSAMQNEELTKEERMYAKRVYDHLLEDCADVIDELDQVITKEKLEMNDAERMGKIAQLYKDMKDNYIFSQLFAKEASVLVTSRALDRVENGKSKRLYGLN